MTASVQQTKDIIVSCIEANVPVMLEGSPGTGKSSVFKQVAEELGIGFIDVRLTQMDAVDVGGVPSIHKNRTLRNPPSWMPLLDETGNMSNSDLPERGILLFDELPTAAPEVQVTAYQIFQDRELSGYKMAPGWVPCAAGNRVDEFAEVNPMPTPLRNRMIVVEMENNVHSWTKWAVKNGIDPDIIGYIQFRPDHLNDFKDLLEAGGNTRFAFATQRSWATFNKVYPKIKHDPALLSLTCEGCVGSGISSEFCSYTLTLNKAPSFESIIASPNKAEIPDETSAVFAVVSMLALQVSGPNQIDSAFTYVKRLPKSLQALYVSLLKMKDVKELVKADGVMDWCENNQEVVGIHA